MKHISTALIIVCLLTIQLFSCEKVNVTFTDNQIADDPDITYNEDYKVEVSTYKTDSFITSGSDIFMLGTHQDSLFGKISTDSYAEIQVPAENAVENTEVIFDSLELALMPNGNYYGDTNTVFKISIHQLLENIKNTDESVASYYNPRSFAYRSVPLGEAFIQIHPNRKKEITVRLSDALGQEWLAKFKNDADEIQSQENFRKYFKGICITTDSLFNNSLYYFTAIDTTTIIRLHYRQKGSVYLNKVLEFSYTAANQFNHIKHRFTGTPFASFKPYKNQVLSSSLLNDKAFINNNIPCYAKITFPDILSVKELYPYIKIIRAELEVTPAPGTYNYPNRLPEALQIYLSNDNNSLDSYLTDINGNTQNGNLTIDELYGDNTKYTFDITSFINTILSEGRFSTKAIFLAPASALNFDETSRLIFNDQQNKSGIKLKLYVLGL